MGKIFLTNRTVNGQAYCGVSRNRTASRHGYKGNTKASPDNLREDFSNSKTSGNGVQTKTKKMTNKNIPSNEKVLQNKEKMDDLIHKLDKVKIQRKNIIFEI